MKTKNVLVSVFLLLLLASAAAIAAPSFGDKHVLRQPDGTLVTTRIFGDEFYRRVESLEGYTLVRDAETGWIVYAELSDDGDEFIPTDIKYTDTSDFYVENDCNILELCCMQYRLSLDIV